MNSMETNNSTPLLLSNDQPSEQITMNINRSDTRQPVNYDRIDLSVVIFNRIFYRNKGTLSQIVKSLDDMADRLTEPGNDYQKELYPYICKECKKVVETYSKLVDTINPIDNNVFGFYLNGPHNDGQRKATTTTHERKSYGVSEYKETLKSINDRLRHIKIDCQRRVYRNSNPSAVGQTTGDSPSIIARPSVSNDVLNRLIDFSDQYHKYIDQYMADWDGFIAQFRSTNNVQQNPIVQQPRPPTTEILETVQGQIEVQPVQSGTEDTQKENIQKQDVRKTRKEIRKEMKESKKASRKEMKKNKQDSKNTKIYSEVNLLVS
jgi:hypothetical protein